VSQRLSRLQLLRLMRQWAEGARTQRARIQAATRLVVKEALRPVGRALVTWRERCEHRRLERRVLARMRAPKVVDRAAYEARLLAMREQLVQSRRAAEAYSLISETEPPLVGQPHKEMKKNPKATYAPQMFGLLDMVTNEWTEGIFASLWRKANKDKKHFTWLVLDGPVDAIWIENMNTVMDDNQILTLANKDRISMLRPNCTLHFEVDDLCNASPATVSRAGIIYVSLVDLGWQPYYVSWLKEIKRPKAEDELLSKLFDKVVTAIFELLLFECSPCMYKTPIVLLGAYVAGCTFFQSIITKPYNSQNLMDDFKPLIFYGECRRESRTRERPISSPTRRASSSTSTSSSVRARCPTSSRAMSSMASRARFP
jgi:hypothetical protein